MGRKYTGFNCPLHPCQLLSWLFTAFHISTEVLILLDLDLLPLIILSILLGVSQLSEVVAAFICTKSDPTDPLSILHKYDSSKDELFEAMCMKCDAFVEPHSKHCSACNRCVTNFDHHCKWVNNCIGQKNYKSFFIMIIALEVNLVTSFVLEMILVHGSKEYIFIMLILDSILSFVIICFNGILIGFHIFLITKKMTTFEYIIKRKNRKQVYSYVNNEEALKIEQDAQRPDKETAEHTLKQISEESKTKFSLRLHRCTDEVPDINSL